MNWRISKRTVAVTVGVAVLLVVGLALVLWTMGWFGNQTDTTVSPGQSPSPSPSASSSPSQTAPGTHPTEPQDGTAAPTVADLRKHLAGILRSTPFGSNVNRQGRLVCDGSGPIGEGTALRCEWHGVYPGSGGAEHMYQDPVFVAVLDDSGRYTFQMRGVDPSLYPKDTTDCRTLMSGPVDAYPGGAGMGYPTLLYYWMASGSPATMDDDGNGLPCETVYPAAEVARVSSSPLVPGNNPGVDHTIEDVRQHLEAVFTGLSGPAPRLPGLQGLRLRSANNPDGSDADAGSPAVTGTAIEAVWPLENGLVQITVVDDEARYAYSHTRCCGWGPNVTDYSDDASCKQLSERLSDVPDHASGWTDGLTYPFVVYYWMSHGNPDRLDKDGNGKPCEAQYPAAEVKRYFGSTLQP